MSHNLIQGKKLIKFNTTTTSVDDEYDNVQQVLNAKKYTLLYFSASWCPPCQQFTPELINYYQQYHESKSFEVVFVSSDRDESSFMKYFQKMPWYAVPLSDRQTKNSLSKKFKIQGIPTLVVLESETGKMITDSGVEDLLYDTDNFPWHPKGFHDSLGTTFVDNKGQHVSFDQLKDLEAVGVYFSAHWCPPCRSFTPKLVDTYKKLNENGKRFEVVFVSGDRKEDQFNEYFAEMPWLAIPFNDRETRGSALNKFFQVEGIPQLSIVNPKTGEIIQQDARTGVSSDPNGNHFPWYPKDVEELTDVTAATHFNSDACLILFSDKCSESVRAQNANLLNQLASKYVAEWKKDRVLNRPIFFLHATDSPILSRVRQFTGLSNEGDQDGKTMVVILNVPENFKYVHSGGDISLESLDDLVSRFIKDEIEAQPIHQEDDDEDEDFEDEEEDEQ